MLLNDWIIILIAFVGIWIGATLAVKPIDEIAKKLNSSSFIVSFFILGLFTSLTEVSVAYNSFIEDRLEISVGNLLGGSLVLLMFVIPLLGMLAKGIHLSNGFGVRNTFLCILFLLVPHIFLLDNVLSLQESWSMFVMYVILALFLYFGDKASAKKVRNKRKIAKLHHSKVALAVSFVTVGSIILIFSSNILVEGIDKIGSSINLSPFILALIGLSIGTNLPEISLVIIAAIKGRSEIGFGNYLGSALFNPLIMSVLGLVSGGIILDANFTKLLIFSVLGFILFFIFMRSRSFLSQKESAILLSIYVVFVISELAF